MKLNNFFVILVLEISIFICNSNVTYLTKHCNLPIVTLQRKQVKNQIKMKKLKNSVLALACVSSMFAFSQEEKVDSLNVLDQRITSVEDAIMQAKN